MISEFFTKTFSGGPFQLFGTSHLIAIALIVLLNLSFLFLRLQPDTGWRKFFRISAAITLILNESLWHIWNLVNGTWTVQTMLPLHLCSVFVFLSAIMLLTRSYAIYEFAYFLGIAGALQAILTPDLGIYDFPHFRYFQVFISHGLIVTAALYMTLVEGYRPTWKSLVKVAVFGNLYMLVIFGLNQLIGSNYMFVAHKPETASLMDVLGPWPLYLLAIEGLAAVMFGLLYLPFAFKKPVKPTADR